MTLIGVASAFPIRSITTLLGVYAATQPSLGRFHFGVFASEVPVLRPKVSPATLNFVSHQIILSAELDKIFHNKYLTPGFITSGCLLSQVF